MSDKPASTYRLLVICETRKANCICFLLEPHSIPRFTHFHFIFWEASNHQKQFSILSILLNKERKTNVSRKTPGCAFTVHQFIFGNDSGRNAFALSLNPSPFSSSSSTSSSPKSAEGKMARTTSCPNQSCHCSSSQSISLICQLAFFRCCCCFCCCAFGSWLF